METITPTAVRDILQAAGKIKLCQRCDFYMSPLVCSGAAWCSTAQIMAVCKERDLKLPHKTWEKLVLNKAS